MFGSDGLLVLADAGLIDYFVDSNKAGKIVICVLAFLNCYAISLMWNKYVLLNKALSRNARDEKRINDLPSIFDYDDALFSGEGSPYLSICSRAMEAARRSKAASTTARRRSCRRSRTSTARCSARAMWAT